MAITLADALTQAQDDLDEISGRTWTLASLRRWANRSAQDISRSAEWKRSSENISATAGTQTYDMGATVLKVHTAGWTESGATARFPLEYLDKQNVESEAGVAAAQARGIPLYYYTWGWPGTATHKINLYPTPSTNGTIDLDFIALSTDLATNGDDDAQNCDIANGFEDVLVLGITYRAMQADGDGRWQEYKAQYDEALKEMTEIALRFSTQPGRIMSDQGRAVPSWLYGGVDTGWGW